VPGRVPTPSDRPPARRRLVSKLLLSLATLAVLFLVLEVSWRAYLWQTGRGFWDDPREFTSPFFTTYEEPRPFVSKAGFQFHGQFAPREKEPGEIRVICFGGSTTVNRREGISYAQLLEPRLAAHAPGRRVRVLNAGGDGYSTAHSLVNFALRGIEARPDIVTIYENINDLSAIRFGDELSPDYANKYETDFYLGMRHRSGPLAGLVKMSRLARAVAFSIMAIRFPEQQETDRIDWREARELYVRNLRSFVALARAHGIKVAIATQPARADVRRDPGFTAFGEAARELAREENVVLIEVEREVTDDRCFLPDAIHYTREGVEAVAERFYPPLAKLVEEVATETGTTSAIR
jgi:lysophospholipase L1-like esterase